LIGRLARASTIAPIVVELATLKIAKPFVVRRWRGNGLLHFLFEIEDGDASSEPGGSANHNGNLQNPHCDAILTNPSPGFEPG
jgi:hypothetical protein